MISQFVRPFGIAKNLLQASCLRFSVTPTPNQNPKDQKSQVKLQADKKPQQKPTEPVNTVSRAQARLKVSRAELSKYARVESDYEKVRLPTQKLQEITKQLKNEGFNIRAHPTLGTRLEFYRAASVKRKPIKKAKVAEQSKEAKDKDNKEQKQQTKKQKEAEEEEEQEEEYEDQNGWQIKIFTSAQKQFSNANEKKYLDSLFEQKEPEDLKSMNFGLKNFNISFKVKEKNGKSARTGKESIEQVLKNLNRTSFQKNSELDESMYINEDDKFRQFTAYVRNADCQQKGKWVKLQLMLEELKFVHIYKISIVTDMDKQLHGLEQDEKQFKGVEANQLDEKLIDCIENMIEHGEGLTGHELMLIYSYTKYSEPQFYRRWLDDLIDITK